MEKAIAGSKFDKLEISSDGTRAGTTIKVNGKEVQGLGSASFCFYNDDFSGNVGFGYTVRDEAADKGGELASTTYYSLVPPNEKAEASIALGNSTPKELLPRVSASMLERFRKIGAR